MISYYQIINLRKNIQAALYIFLYANRFSLAIYWIKVNYIKNESAVLFPWPTPGDTSKRERIERIKATQRGRINNKIDVINK